VRICIPSGWAIISDHQLIGCRSVLINLAKLQRLAVPILLPALARISTTTTVVSLFTSNTQLGNVAKLLTSASRSGRNGVGRRVKKYYHIVGGPPYKISV